MTALLLIALAGFSPGRGDTGLGIIAGNPTGLSFKHFLSTTRGIDAALAWSFGDEWVSVHADYLWHNYGQITVSKGQMPWYYGLGGWAAMGNNDFFLGGRVPLGLSYLFRGSRTELFLETAGTLALIPETDLGLDLAAGVRFYF